MSSQPMRRCESLLLLAILACGLGLRLIEICQPFIDAWSWREADMAMIAENFYRYGFHIFYPQVNWAGNAPGYVGTEFPLVSFLAACLYSVFGVQDWIGRSISVLFYAVSLLFLYFLVRKVSNVRSALLAVAIYTLTPLSIFAGRAFMPDMATLSLSIMALYLFAEWLERQPHTPLFIAVSLATCLALLVKLPSILIGIPMLYMAWEKYGARWVRQRELWAFAAFALAGPLVWYTHAYSISISHAPYHFFGSGGITIESLDWYIGVFYRTVATGLTPIVVVSDACRDHGAAPCSIWQSVPLVASGQPYVYGRRGGGESASVVPTADGSCGSCPGRDGLRFYRAQIDGTHEIKDSSHLVELSIFCGARRFLLHGCRPVVCAPAPRTLECRP
jgi:hypothetical protein